MAAIAIALASCEEDEINGNNNSGNGKSMTFTGAIVSPTTRTVFADETNNDFKVFWNNGDEVNINGFTYKAENNSSDPAPTTTLIIQDSKSFNKADKYYAIYPASLGSSVSTWNESAEFTLPATQQFTDVRKTKHLPMYAFSTTNYLYFKNICGVLGIKVKKEDMDKVTSIKVSNDSKNMNGKFTVVDGNKAVLKENIEPTGAMKDSYNSITLEWVDDNNNTKTYDIETTESGTTFYVALPIPAAVSGKADGYENLTVTVTGKKNTGENNYEDATKKMVARKKFIEIKENTIYNWDFLPEGTYPLTSTPIVSGTVTDGFSKGTDYYGNKILTLTVPANDSPTYATIYCADNNLMVPTGVKVYGFTEKNGTLVKGEAITSTVLPTNYAILPAGKGFLVEVQSSSWSQTVTFSCTDGNATVENDASDLVGFGAVGTPGNFVKDKSKNYYVWCQPDGYNYGWYLYSGETIPEFTAYYAVSKTN